MELFDVVMLSTRLARACITKDSKMIRKRRTSIFQMRNKFFIFYNILNGIPDLNAIFHRIAQVYRFLIASFHQGYEACHKIAHILQNVFSSCKDTPIHMEQKKLIPETNQYSFCHRIL
jgi:hypothetical protein